jgi:hypothetical protein
MPCPKPVVISAHDLFGPGAEWHHIYSGIFFHFHLASHVHYTPFPSPLLPSSLVTDLQGPPSEQTKRKKIDALKRHAQETTRDLRSRDDVQISYLETLEERDNDNLRLAQMLAR